MNDTLRILIVEDDTTISRLLSDIFALGGYKPFQAENVAAAERQIDTGLPDLITLDLNMPGVSGETWLRQLRSRPETRDLPVVVITSQLPVGHPVCRLAAAVVEKPFELTELIDTVERVMGLPPSSWQLVA